MFRHSEQTESAVNRYKRFKNGSMSKAEAIQAMHNGKKVTHYNFSDNEFIYMKDGEIYDENGYSMHGEFWKWRQGECWEKDWSLYEPENKN